MHNRIVLALEIVALGSGLLASAPAQAYQLDTVNLVGCAQDGGVCRMPYPTNVYYGVPGRTNGRPFPQGGVVPCNSQTFGDPAPGQPKSCWYAPRITAGGGGERYRDDDDGPRRGYDDRPRRDDSGTATITTARRCDAPTTRITDLCVAPTKIGTKIDSDINSSRSDVSSLLTAVRHGRQSRGPGSAGQAGRGRGR